MLGIGTVKPDKLRALCKLQTTAAATINWSLHEMMRSQQHLLEHNQLCWGHVLHPTGAPCSMLLFLFESIS